MAMFALHERTRIDERYTQLSAIGRLTFIHVGVAFDPNWGHAEYNVTCLVAQAFPVEQERADDGDEAAEAWILEAKQQLRLAVEIGLFLLEETPWGRIIAYRQWERYHETLDRRGRPKHPMGPVIAATRDWSKVGKNSIDTTSKWASDHGLIDVVRSNPVRVTTCAGTVPEQSANCSPWVKGPDPVPDPEPGSSALRAGAREALPPLPRTNESTSTDRPERQPIRAQVLVAAGLKPTEQSEQVLTTALDTLRSEAMRNGQAIASAAAYAAYCSSNGKTATLDGLIRSLARDDAHQLKQETSGVPPGRGRRYHPPETYASAEEAQAAADRWNAGRDVNGQPRERRADDAGDGGSAT